jgi:hypothetical protein
MFCDLDLLHVNHLSDKFIPQALEMVLIQDIYASLYKVNTL